MENRSRNCRGGIPCAGHRRSGAGRPGPGDPDADHRTIFTGGPVGIDTIAAALGEERITIEDVDEPYLIQTGLLNRTPKGRNGFRCRRPASGNRTNDGGGLRDENITQTDGLDSETPPSCWLPFPFFPGQLDTREEFYENRPALRIFGDDGDTDFPPADL